MNRIPSRERKRKKEKEKGRTCLSISGKIALRWSSTDACDAVDWDWEGEAEMDRGGENRTGDEEEQRILLETGGVVGRSSKKDLFPHTMADMFRFRLLPSFPTLSPADSPPLPPSCSCSDFSVYFSSPMLFKPIFAQPSRIKNPPVVVRIRKNQGSELGLGFFSLSERIMASIWSACL